MKKIRFFLLLFCAVSISVSAQKVNIVINNPSAITRSGAIVSIKWTDVIAKYAGIDTANFKVVDLDTKQELPFQLEYIGQKAIQNLLVQLSIEPKGQCKLSLITGKPTKLVQKTFARYVPERFDDFAWENDKVAYRMYGKALESRKDNAFGTDVWAKRTRKLVINDWYKSGDYHADHGDGLDYYSVGLTLGAGDIAPFVKDSIYFSKNYHHWKVLDNGPLRSTFELGYDEWDVAGNKVKVTKTISLDAGSQMNKVTVNYTYTGADALPVAVGIVKRKEPGSMLMDEQQGVMAYWEPKHGADGTIGVGVIIPAALKMNVDKGHLLVHAAAKNNQPLVYYNGSAWDKAGEIIAAKAWFDYLYNFKQQLQQPLKVELQ